MPAELPARLRRGNDPLGVGVVRGRGFDRGSHRELVDLAGEIRGHGGIGDRILPLVAPARRGERQELGGRYLVVSERAGPR